MRRRTNPLLLIAALIALAITAFWQERDDPQTPAAAPERVERPAPERSVAPPLTPEPAAVEQQTAWPRVAQLVADAQEGEQLLATLTLIERGGPFPYPKKDGSVFSNREGRLPRRERGYYREYTVPTAGASSRGARRVVRGSEGETYYTRDHYDSFVRLDE